MEPTPVPAPVPIAGLTPDEVLPGELTFGQLLAGITGADQELLAKVDIEKLVPHLMGKVDGCRYVIDKCEDAAARLKVYRDEFDAAISAVQNVGKRIEERMAFLMEASSVPLITGFRHVVKLQKNSRAALTISPAFAAPDSDTYRKYPNLIKRSYSWDKDALLKAIEAGEPLSEIAVAKRGHQIKWSANKGGIS
jgi:hypothetical protein